MPTVLIDNRQKRKKINIAGISQTASNVLRRLGQKETELSLVFVADKEIALLNKKYLSHPQPTDVLAFPMDSHPKKSCAGAKVLGDVVISVERALAQSKERGEPFERELTRLIIHGILHLIGYSDKKKRDRLNMFSRQEKILSSIHETA